MRAAQITRVDVAAVRIVGPCLIVRVWAGDTYGLGECYPSGPATAVDAVITSLTELLIGEEPRDVHRVAEKMRRWQIFNGGQAGTVVTAISGLVRSVPARTSTPGSRSRICSRPARSTW